MRVHQKFGTHVDEDIESFGQSELMKEVHSYQHEDLTRDFDITGPHTMDDGILQRARDFKEGVHPRYDSQVHQCS